MSLDEYFRANEILNHAGDKGEGNGYEEVFERAGELMDRFKDHNPDSVRGGLERLILRTGYDGWTSPT